MNNNQALWKDDDWKKARHVNHKKSKQKNELWQLSIHHMKFLEDNHMKNYVESISNIYLQHYALKINI
jgi:DNA-binding SARP family transcriptional activator